MENFKAEDLTLAQQLEVVQLFFHNAVCGRLVQPDFDKMYPDYKENFDLCTKTWNLALDAFNHDQVIHVYDAVRELRYQDPLSFEELDILTQNKVLMNVINDVLIHPRGFYESRSTMMLEELVEYAREYLRHHDPLYDKDGNEING